MKELETHERYMRRCIALAEAAAGRVAPNPMVGAVLVYDQTIIGEGRHEYFGGPHAEVNCLASVPSHWQPFIPSATLYVSLEPCVHTGKTPPCTDLILRSRIPRVVIGCRDPFSRVNGKGIEQLRAAGVEVLTGVMEKECRELNKRFFTFHTLHRPYIVLKWAQTANKRIAGEGSARLMISNGFSNRLVHRWRAAEAAILVGTNTALLDDPALTVRRWTGVSPVRLVVDMNLRLPPSLRIFDGEVRTIVFNTVKHDQTDNLLFYQVATGTNMVHQLVHALYHLEIQSVLVEGGARLLQSFIDEDTWDEARVITNSKLLIDGGLPAPVLRNQIAREQLRLKQDIVDWYSRIN